MFRLADVGVWIDLLLNGQLHIVGVQGETFTECIYLVMVNDVLEQKERGQLVLHKRGGNRH